MKLTKEILDRIAACPPNWCEYSIIRLQELYECYKNNSFITLACPLCDMEEKDHPVVCDYSYTSGCYDKLVEHPCVWMILAGDNCISHNEIIADNKQATRMQEILEWIELIEEAQQILHNK